MQYTVLGNTGIRVSELCFGTMSFGSTADERMSAALFERCLDSGINFFDCANIYAGTESERILGRLMHGKRDDLVITSKVCFPVGDGVNDRGLSRRHIMMQIDATLSRLGTDRLDFYFLHSFDPDTAIEETLRAMDDLVRAGKILYPAVSNWAAWQIAKGLGIAALEQLAPFQCIQPMYNLAKRQAEVELLPLAQSENLGVIPYSPLGGGLLTGKYSTKSKPKHGRLVEHELYVKRYGATSNYEIAETFAKYAAQKSVHPATLAVAWVASHPAVTAPIIGARTVDQLEASLAAADVELTAQERREISAISPEPPPATDRSEELN